MNGVMVMTQESVFPASGILEAENQPETRSARRILPPDQLTRIHIAFDSRRPAANLKLFLPVTLSHHLGLGGLVNRHVDPGNAPGWAHAGGKLLTLVASALAGGLPEADIDNADCPHVSHLSLSSAESSRMMPGILPKSASAVTMRVTPKMDWCPLQWYLLHTIGCQSTAGRAPGQVGRDAGGFHYNRVNATNHPEAGTMPSCTACGAEPEPPVRAPHTVYVQTLYRIAGQDYCRHHIVKAAGLITEIKPGAGPVMVASPGMPPQNPEERAALADVMTVSGRTQEPVSPCYSPAGYDCVA